MHLLVKLQLFFFYMETILPQKQLYYHSSHREGCSCICYSVFHSQFNISVFVMYSNSQTVEKKLSRQVSYLYLSALFYCVSPCPVSPSVPGNHVLARNQCTLSRVVSVSALVCGVMTLQMNSAIQEDLPVFIVIRGFLSETSNFKYLVLCLLSFSLFKYVTSNFLIISFVKCIG